MTKKLLTLGAAAAMALPAVAVPAADAHAQEASWIHVRVDENDGEKVRLNLPIAMVDVALETLRREGFEDADIRLGPDENLTLDDLRRMWREMRDAGDAEFVNVQDGDERVRIFRQGDYVYVHVDEGETEQVRVQMPVEIADALLGGEGDQIDLAAAIQELARRGEQDLVRVRDTDATVRVWVDENAGQDGEGSSG